MLQRPIFSEIIDSEADSGLVKLVVMTNQQRFKYVTQIRFKQISFMQKVKTDLYKKANFQNLVAQNLK